MRNEMLDVLGIVGFILFWSGTFLSIFAMIGKPILFNTTEHIAMIATGVGLLYFSFVIK